MHWLALKTFWFMHNMVYYVNWSVDFPFNDGTIKVPLDARGDGETVWWGRQRGTVNTRTLLSLSLPHTHCVWVTCRQTPLLRSRRPSLISRSDSADSEHKRVCLWGVLCVCVCWPEILCDSTMNERDCTHVGICVTVCVCVCCRTSWSGISEERVFPSTAAVR